MQYPDLVQTAEWAISDRDTGGFVRRRYRPFSGETPIIQHPGDAGRPQAPWLAPDILPVLVAAYDGTGS